MASKLITESDVKRGAVDDPLIVDADTVITPSALDAAYARGIRVVFARDRHAGMMRSAISPFRSLPDPPAVPTPSTSPPAEVTPSPPSNGKSCGCACACGTAQKPTSNGVQHRHERDWVDILVDQRRKGFDAAAFRP